jgi:hypothetical protein
MASFHFDLKEFITLFLEKIKFYNHKYNSSYFRRRFLKINLIIGFQIEKNLTLFIILK